MANRVKLNEVTETLQSLDYPITRVDAAQALEGHTLVFADGEDNLGALVSETGSDTFSSASELTEELYAQLPVEAVGEPGQSEGEG